MSQANATASSFTTHDPATGEVLATLPVNSKADVDAAVQAARAAQPAWAAVDPTRRTRLLIRLAELVE